MGKIASVEERFEVVHANLCKECLSKTVQVYQGSDTSLSYALKGMNEQHERDLDDGREYIDMLRDENKLLEDELQIYKDNYGELHYEKLR